MIPNRTLRRTRFSSRRRLRRQDCLLNAPITNFIFWPVHQIKLPQTIISKRWRGRGRRERPRNDAGIPASLGRLLPWFSERLEGRALKFILACGGASGHAL